MIASLTAMLMAATPTFAQQTTLQGTGSAPVTRDVDSVRALAERHAREDLVRTFGRQIIGHERSGELTDGIVAGIADQIRSDMITHRSSERVGQTFRVTLTAQIDRRWFADQLNGFAISTPLTFAGAENQVIVVMIEESIGVAADFERPAEIVTEYDRDRGSSYSDRSTLAYSDRERSADSSSVAARNSSSGAYAVGYGNGYGSAAASGRAASSGALAARSSSAASRNTALIDRTAVEADSHDVERFRQRITFQSAARTQTGEAAMSALKDGLRDHSINTSDARVLLDGFSPGATPLFQEARAQGLFAYAAANSIPYIMSGRLEINHGGRHAATNEVTCSGRFYADVFGTSGQGADIANGSAQSRATGADSADCENRLTAMLATEVANKIGPDVQIAWRENTRRANRNSQLVSGPASWALTVRGANLDTAAQLQVMDALAEVSGLDRHALLSQSANQMEFELEYSGSMPLNMALARILVTKPGFAGASTEMAPGRLTICQSGC